MWSYRSTGNCSRWVYFNCIIKRKIAKSSATGEIVLDGFISTASSKDISFHLSPIPQPLQILLLIFPPHNHCNPSLCGGKSIVTQESSIAFCVFLLSFNESITAFNLSELICLAMTEHCSRSLSCLPSLRLLWAVINL